MMQRMLFKHQSTPGSPRARMPHVGQCSSTAGAFFISHVHSPLHVHARPWALPHGQRPPLRTYSSKLSGMRRRLVQCTLHRRPWMVGAISFNKHVQLLLNSASIRYRTAVQYLQGHVLLDPIHLLVGVSCTLYCVRRTCTWLEDTLGHRRLVSSHLQEAHLPRSNGAIYLA
jgi:hypothetical protein